MEFGKYFSPMLLEEEKKSFNSKKFLFELKFDGIRATIHVGKNTFKIFSRNGKEITDLYPELKHMQALVKENTIFDGEIVLFSENKPDFSKLQERAHLKNKEKIKYFSKKNPVCFMVFDIVYKNKPLHHLPLIKRKKILEKQKENDALIKVHYVLENGKELFKKVKKMKLEGIVAKNINSIYEINTRSKSWLKIKNWQTETFYIGGYVNSPKEQMMKLYLGEIKENKLYFVGKIMMNKKNALYSKIIKEKIKKSSPFCNYKKEEISFVNPKLTCEVLYIERTKQNHLRQAILKI